MPVFLILYSQVLILRCRAENSIYRCTTSEPCVIFLCLSDEQGNSSTVLHSVFIPVNLLHHQYFLKQLEFFQPKLYLNSILSQNRNLRYIKQNWTLDGLKLITWRQYTLSDWTLSSEQNQSGLKSLLCHHQMAMLVSTLSSLSPILPIYEIYITELKAIMYNTTLSITPSI